MLAEGFKPGDTRVMSTSVSCPCDRYYDGSCTAVATCERGIITIPTAEVTAHEEIPLFPNSAAASRLNSL